MSQRVGVKATLHQKEMKKKQSIHRVYIFPHLRRHKVKELELNREVNHPIQQSKSHIITFSLILVKQHTGQRLSVPFPHVTPWCFLPLIWGKGLTHLRGGVGRWQLPGRILELAREDERDVDLIKTLPLSWELAVTKGTVRDYTACNWKRTKWKIM